MHRTRHTLQVRKTSYTTLHTGRCGCVQLNSFRPGCMKGGWHCTPHSDCFNCRRKGKKQWHQGYWCLWKFLCGGWHYSLFIQPTIANDKRSFEGHVSEHGKVVLSKRIHIVTQIPVLINGSQDPRVHKRQQEYIETLKLNLQHPQVCACTFSNWQEKFVLFWW